MTKLSTDAEWSAKTLDQRKIEMHGAAFTFWARGADPKKDKTYARRFREVAIATGAPPISYAWADKMSHPDLVDWMEFASALEQSCPKGVNRDRFGRITDAASNTEPLRRLAVKWQIENGGYDTLDQAAMIARKMLQAGGPD
jgi:hypothetical protein